MTESLNYGDTTDPKEHSIESFRYLIHGVLCQRSKYQSLLDGLPDGHATPPISTIRELSTSGSLDVFIPGADADGDPFVDLAMHPEHLDSRVTLSASLVDQEWDMQYLWSSTGLIIEAPKPSVISAHLGDLGARNEDLEVAREIGESFGILPPDKIVRYSENEVLLLGKTAKEKIKLVGLYATSGAFNSEYEYDQARIMQDNAKRLQLPFIEL